MITFNRAIPPLPINDWCVRACVAKKHTAAQLATNGRGRMHNDCAELTASVNLRCGGPSLRGNNVVNYTNYSLHIPAGIFML